MLGLVFTAALGSILASRTAQAQDGMKTVKVEIDGRKAKNRAGEAALESIASMQSFDLVCLDIQIVMDGSQPNAALASTESDTQRYPVACRPGRMGEFPMGSGVEYLLPNVGTVDKQSLSVLLFPGSRTEYRFNAVDCISDPQHAGAAVFRIRGFFTVDNKNLGDNRQIELRAASDQNEPSINRAAAAACLR
jgi:hypothetical protein